MKVFQKSAVILVAQLGLTIMLSANAQRSSTAQVRASKPTGAEIAAAARSTQLDAANIGTAIVGGKSMRFTPARQASGTVALADPGTGAFLGVLENELAGDETSLPAGKFNLFVANVGGQWHAYAEARGQLVAEAARVTVTPGKGPAVRPRFEAKGWCVIIGWRCVEHATDENRYDCKFIKACW